MNHILKCLGLRVTRYEASIFFGDIFPNLWIAAISEFNPHITTGSDGGMYYSMPVVNYVALCSEQSWKQYNDRYNIIWKREYNNQTITISSYENIVKKPFGGTQPKNPFAKHQPWKKNYKSL
jgi:hypothetical protein